MIPYYGKALGYLDSGHQDRGRNEKEIERKMSCRERERER